MVEPVTRALLGAIDVDDGPTDEQSAVLRAVVVHLWQRPDLELDALDAVGPGRHRGARHRCGTRAAGSRS